MDKLYENLINILNEIDEEIVEYKGENLIEEGLLDSFTIIAIIAMIDEKIKISIPADEVKQINFRTVNSIYELAKKYSKIN